MTPLRLLPAVEPRPADNAHVSSEVQLGRHRIEAEAAGVQATVNATYHELAESKNDSGWHLEYGSDYWEYRRMWEEYPKQRKVHSFPIHLDIEPTNACDLRCPMCPRTIMFENGELGPIGFFDYDIYCQIVSDGVKHGLKSIKLNYLGEPLLHKRIVDMVRFAKKQGVVEVMFNSNGTQLTEDLGRRLIEAGLDRIIFSFDGADKESYEEIRIGADYDKVVANIKRFVRIRNDMGRRLPVVRISMVLMKSNEHLLQKFIDLWTPIVDLVTYSDYVNPQEKFADDEYTVDLDEKEPFCCGQLWQRLFVWQDGCVTPCCADYDKKLKLGDVKQGDKLVDLWHSDKLNEWRQLHMEGRYREIEACRMCGVPRMARALGYTSQQPDE